MGLFSLYKKFYGYWWNHKWYYTLNQRKLVVIRRCAPQVLIFNTIRPLIRTKHNKFQVYISKHSRIRERKLFWVHSPLWCSSSKLSVLSRPISIPCLKLISQRVHELQGSSSIPYVLSSRQISMPNLKLIYQCVLDLQIENCFIGHLPMETLDAHLQHHPPFHSDQWACQVWSWYLGLEGKNCYGRTLFGLANWSNMIIFCVYLRTALVIGNAACLAHYPSGDKGNSIGSLMFIHQDEKH